MLPPALTTPTPPTYGELLDRASCAFEAATTLGAHGFPDVLAAHHEVLGYQRFLHVGGQHLRLLADFAPNSKHLRALAARLTALPAITAPGGRWQQTAVLLGTAHDLLATHLRGPGAGLTPDVVELLRRRDTGGDVTATLTLLIDAAAASGDLFQRAAEAQATSPDHELIETTHVASLRHTTRAVELYGKAALWDLNDTAAHTALTGLEPAAPTAVTASREFESTMAALQALRQLSFRQRIGDDRASAASLNDLARLAVKVTTPCTTVLASPTSPLERVRAAAALDHLKVAHLSWSEASTGLTVSVQSLTRAASPYGRAIARLHQDLDSVTPAIRAAVLTALPRLGEDAAATINRLASTKALVVAERPPASLSARWRPLTTDGAEELEDRFLTAAHATATAATAVTGLTRHRHREGPDRGARRELNRSLQVTA